MHLRLGVRMGRVSLRLVLAVGLLVSCKDKGDDTSAVDADGDGYAGSEDCDDGDSAINPAADEVQDEVDNDCDGVADEYLDLYDDDGDGWSEAAGDCDDDDPAYSPAVEEDLDDGLDNDCDGMTDETTDQEDDDEDGYTEEAGDCDDADATTYPDAAELADELDNDCDDVVDEDTEVSDDDGDGFTELDGDCDDASASAYPGGEETWYDGVDGDCSGGSDDDQDGDGLGWDEYGGSDCDDTDPAISPGATEICDGVDNNCNDSVDEGFTPGSEESCPATSCFAVLENDPTSEDGVYWLDPLGGDAREVHCSISSGGWALVYRGTNAGGVAENGTVDSTEELGELPVQIDSEGSNKLSDDFINALRTGHSANDIHVLVTLDGGVLGQAWHPATCTFQSGALLGTDDPCNSSTTVGPDDTEYDLSGSQGPLTRWDVDAEFGYIWGMPGTFIGPIEGGTDNEGALPDPYCTWYDDRTCPVATAFEIWVQ